MTNIKKIRVTKDYTQIKVFMDTGITQSTLSKYENGTLLPTAANLIKLAAYYKTSTDYLLGLTDDPTPRPPKTR